MKQLELILKYCSGLKKKLKRLVILFKTFLHTTFNLSTYAPAHPISPFYVKIFLSI